LYYSFNPEEAMKRSEESSKTTHYSQQALECCKYFCGLIIGALKGVKKEELLRKGFSPIEGFQWKNLHKDVQDVVDGSFKRKSPPEINNGGYCVTSLEAALWAFYSTDSFKEGLLKVVNLGDDADTVGCIYGQLAGVYYGASGIPSEWMKKVALAPLIEIYA